jgi:transcription-repair coupling factor (superfamily II helicase)
MTELTRPTRTIVNVPDGMQPLVLARLVEERLKAAPDATVSLVFVARDGRRLQRMEDVLRAMLPAHTILTLPAWDCLPYDRVSPNGVTIAARMTTLSALTDAGTKGAIVLTAVNALIQKLPPADMVAGMSFGAKAGQVVDSDRLVRWAALNGYLRVPTVRETGEYAVRGGLVDLFPASMETPLRFDFFGKQLESIRTFDPDTQRTTGTIPAIALAPMSEVLLNDETIKRFRARYTTMFGGNTGDDPLYGAAVPGDRALAGVHLRPSRSPRRLHRRRAGGVRRPGGGSLCRPAGAGPGLLRGPRGSAARQEACDRGRAVQSGAAE